MKIPVKTKTNIRIFMLFAYCFIFCGCGQSEIESLFSERSEMTGDPVEVMINLTDSPVYGARIAESRSDCDTLVSDCDEPLIAEWVKPKRFSPSRFDEDSEGPAIAAIELYTKPDTASTYANTRVVMATGYYFRVIAFKLSGSSYVYQCAADYTSNGASVPVLRQGKMVLSMGHTYRFVAYSFNNSTALGNLPTSCIWNSTVIPIPNLNNDFMTFDSGNRLVTGDKFSLTVSFIHQLCKLTVGLNVSGFDDNTFSNCTGVSVNQGGNSSSWTIGQSNIAANTNNTANFNISNNSTATVRIVPFAKTQQVSVYFKTLSVGGKSANGTTVASTQSIQLEKGQNYTMTVRFKKRMGTKVPVDEISGTNGCTDADKVKLAALTWADGNLNSEEQTNLTWATSSSDYGLYYTWKSTYTGNTGINGIDPCTRLDQDIYGSGWRTPSTGEFSSLARCSFKEDALVDGVKGRWFMNEKSGIFLPYAGYRGKKSGSGSVGEALVGEAGHYWTPQADPYGFVYFFAFDSKVVQLAIYDETFGMPVRCVK